MAQKFAFSGRMGSGKDYVAKEIGAQIFGFADPIYVICDYYLGTRDKANVEVREFMQMVGQVGRGAVTPKYPATRERCLFVQQMREVAPREIFKHLPEYLIECPAYAPGDAMEGLNAPDAVLSPINPLDSLWVEYGRRADFWVKLLLNRMRLTERLKRCETDAEPIFAVTNARFENELASLKSYGCEHYHVMCREDTRQRRLGTGWNEKANADISEQMAIKLDAAIPAANYLWNDDGKAPCRLASKFIDSIKAKRK